MLCTPDSFPAASSADRSSIDPKSSRRWTATCVAALVLLACGGGGGGGDVEGPSDGSSPSFANPTVSPDPAQWGTAGARFVVSGGSNLKGRSFTARLGTTACVSATVDDADPTKLDVVCDIPRGGPSSSLSLQILFEGKEVYGTANRLFITLDWPPATGAASFSSGSASSTGTWWQTKAPVRVTGGVNLPGHTLTAVMDGLACSAIDLSSEDPGTLEFTCPTRPGGPGTTAKLAIQENGATIPGGDFLLDLAECASPSAPSRGVPLPQLCNAPAGTTAAASAGLEGVWGERIADSRALFAGNGQFLAWDFLANYWGGQWVSSGLTWTASSAEHFTKASSSAFSETSPFTPFGSVTKPSLDDYLPANALAVSQSGASGTAGVAGTWGASTDDLTLTVDSSGAFTGKTSGTTFGTCTLSGTVTVIAPPRNMLSIALTATGGSSCNIWQSSQLTGLGYIDVVNVGTSTAPSYAYALTFIARSAGNQYMVASALRQ